MPASNGINIIFGAAGYGENMESMGLDSHAIAQEQLQVLADEGITTLDTAELYQGSEAELAYQKAPERFVIHTKLKGGFAPGRDKAAIIAAGEESLRLLKVDQVDVLYIHAPDQQTPVLEQAQAYDVLYKKGVFERLGLSNFTPEDVKEFYETAKCHDCVLPSVYQGSYSPIGRLPETELLPLLRSLNIAYNAYSPIAGGLLTKTKEQFLQGVSRFNPSTRLGQIYQFLFNKPSFLQALDRWGEIATEAGMPRAELAYRWVVYHSALKGEHDDGIILGARDAAQLRESIRFIRTGPLPEHLAKEVDGVWDLVRQDAALDNWNGFFKVVMQ
ncbi:putative oxidoreductase [Stachybotrys elegans]|uniref:Oxidoreductase n=1 Tax=Stachybotrys elegans TaxID=80388 RepID=A0A8K0SDY8_9HYPO|nr:putative oxidoreductase [Stachybotrys elegans]